MSLVLDHPHLIDTLRYKVFAHRRASQDEVQVNVEVSALVPRSDRDTAGLEARIREALRTFIDSEWALLRIERLSEATGYERLRLMASTRVPSAENYDLVDRCRIASREGLALTQPSVNYALSRARVSAVVAELMTDVLEKVGVQVKAFSERTGRAWRIGDIEFGVAEMSSGSQRTGKGAYRDTAGEELMDLLAEDNTILGNVSGSETIWLAAAVTLKCAA